MAIVADAVREKGATVKRLLFVLLAVALAAVLLALPAAARWFYYHEGVPRAREVPRPDLAAVAAPTPQMPAFTDSFEPADPGTVLVDRAHHNNLQVSELNALKARLEARGQRIELVESVDDLAGQLRHARALVTISPRDDWTADEIRSVKQFVDKGGRLLLVTDATRYEFSFDADGNYLGMDHDAAHMNELAGQFGLIFQPDYLYNTSEHESNFRNIKLSSFDANPLTEGLTQVIFYATRSILSQEPALIQATGATRSSASEQADALAVAVLAHQGQVLALGDLTFMTEPFNAVADNNRLTARIADFLSGGQRRFDLTEFPFFFRDEVDLVFAGGPVLDSDLLAGGGVLQAAFDENGKQLTVQHQEDKTRDTLFVGLYDQAKEAQPYLAEAQVTLSITPTKEEASGDESPPASSTEVTVTAEISPAMPSRVEIQSFGEMVVTGTSLLALATDGERHVLVVLAHTQTGVEDAIKRLTDGDLGECVLRATQAPSQTLLALCPTGEVKPGAGEGGWTNPEAEPASKQGASGPEEKPTVAKGNILIVALDVGKGRYDSLTGAEEFAAILKDGYKTTLWSKKQDGLPGSDVIAANDLVVFASGDYPDALGDAENALVLQIMLHGTPVILSGAYLGNTGTESVLRDIQVKEADHPIASGFEPGQVIALLPGPSGSEYKTELLGSEADAAAIPFVRGPASEDKGTAALMVLEETASGLRAVFMGLPIYLLPEEARTRLVTNTVGWLLKAGQG